MPRRSFVLPTFGNADYKPKVRGNVEFELAKTILRRAGFVVYNAEVTDGRNGRGFVKVNNVDCTPEEVIKRAVEMK